jgi:hypothetical protein
MRIYCMGKVCDYGTVDDRMSNGKVKHCLVLQAFAFSNRAFLNGGNQSILCFSNLSLRHTAPGIHLTGRCVGPGASEDVREKSQFLPRIQP